jgi:uncharacterized protein YggE
MRTKLTLLTLLLLVSTMLGACVSVSPSQNVRTLNVNGQAQVVASPDIAYISIGVHSENVNAAEAVAANTAQAQRVMDALKALGIDAKDMQTTNFSIYPQDEYNPEGQRTGTRFVVDNTVYVTLRDLTKIGEILGGAVDAGANSIYGISFDVFDKTAILADARNKAIENARKQAEEVASASGVKLGDVQSINFYNSYPTPVFDAKVASQAMGVGGGAPPISPGQMTFTVDVSIAYEIR